jgi:hypothetical protein
MIMAGCAAAPITGRRRLGRPRLETPERRRAGQM